MPWDGETMGELEVRGAWIASALLRRRLAGRPLVGGRLVRDRRHRHDRADRLHRDPGPRQGPRQVGRRVDLDRGARERADGPSGRGRGGGDRGARIRSGTSGRSRSCVLKRGRDRDRATSCASSWRRTSRSGGSRTRSSSWPRSRRPPSASSARPPCASSSRSSRRPRSADRGSYVPRHGRQVRARRGDGRAAREGRRARSRFSTCPRRM